MKYSAVSFPPCAMSLVTPMTADEKARASGILAGGISGDLWCVLELGLCLWGGRFMFGGFLQVSPSFKGITLSNYTIWLKWKTGAEPQFGKNKKNNKKQKNKKNKKQKTQRL